MVLNDGINVRRDRPRSRRDSEDVFNPRDHNIDEVKAYIAEHPDQTEAVLAAEESGEDRVTLVEWLSAQLDEE